MSSSRQPRSSAQAAQARIALLLNALATSNQDQPIIRGLTLADISSFISSGGFDDDLDEEDDNDDEYNNYYYVPEPLFEPVTEPQEAGVRLLNSGDFGRVHNRLKNSRKQLNLGSLLMNRVTQPYPRLFKEDYASHLVPNTNGTAVASYGANIYTGQFSRDSSFYYTCSQDFRLHIYDTSVPPAATISYDIPDLQTRMPVKRSIQAQPGRWTITDANLSADNSRMVYSSITSTAYMTSTVDPSPIQVPIPFGESNRRGIDTYERLAIWSCRFSADGNEIVAGGSGKIFVYDLLANRRSVKINAHSDDVNSCCWADTSGNVLISASDDSSLKVWDRRSLGTSRKPAGVLIGHTEGITYVSAKGDGRYVISNGKDQTLRLWDMRYVRSNAEFEEVADRKYGTGFDYRSSRYRRPKYQDHPRRCDIMAYRGHAVLRTLIRCHFSPEMTTGCQYIYSGSADGRIHIWSLDGRVVQVLDRSKTEPMTCDPSDVENSSAASRQPGPVCVRDLSWSAQEPYLLSAGWNDMYGGSVIARHEWKGLAKMSGSLEDWTEKHQQEAEERAGRFSAAMPGAYDSEESEMDDVFEA